MTTLPVNEAVAKALMANIDVAVTLKQIAKAIDTPADRHMLPHLMATFFSQGVDLQYATDALDLAVRKARKAGIEPNFAIEVEQVPGGFFTRAVAKFRRTA